MVIFRHRDWSSIPIERVLTDIFSPVREEFISTHPVTPAGPPRREEP
jgi:hypothetical protein